LLRWLDAIPNPPTEDLVPFVADIITPALETGAAGLKAEEKAFVMDFDSVEMELKND
jgi:hypothetical protein